MRSTGQRCFLLLSIQVVHLLTWCTTANDANITEGPVSVTVLVGTNAQFHCAGTGNYLVWEVDRLQADHSSISARGITSDTTTDSGTVQSNLTVPATSVNNGTTVRCAISVSLFSTPVVSNYSTLTVLPGIGRVLNLRFNPSFSQVLWDPPSTAGVLGHLTYQVTLINNVSSELILNKTTNNTYSLLPTVQPCQYYTATVTAFSFEYHGDSVDNKQRIPGEYYTVQSMSQEVAVNPDGISPSVVLLIALNIKLPGAAHACSGQRLTFATYPQSNTSDITTHPDYDIVTRGGTVYSITDGIVKELLYATTISLVGSEGAVDVLKFTFSTFSVQDCDVHTDHTSYILVECTFAINSTAPGFVLIQDEHSQYTINTTLQRHEGDVSKGSVNITDLPTGEYNVTVFDEMKDSDVGILPAYAIPKLIEVVLLLTDPNPSTTLIISPVFETGLSTISGSTMSLQLSESVSPTITNPSSISNSIGVIIGIVTGVVILTLIVVVSLLCFFKTYQHKMATLVPVQWSGEKPENIYEPCVKLKPSKRPTFNMSNPVNESAYMELRSDYISDISPTAGVGTHNEDQKFLHYADIQHSTNPPAAPPPTQPVAYAEVKKSPDSTCSHSQVENSLMTETVSKEDDIKIKLDQACDTETSDDLFSDIAKSSGYQSGSSTDISETVQQPDKLMFVCGTAAASHSQHLKQVDETVLGSTEHTDSGYIQSAVICRESGSDGCSTVVVTVPSTAIEKVNDSRSVDFTVNEKSTSCGEFISENPVVDVAEPDLINEDHPSCDSCAVIPSPPNSGLIMVRYPYRNGTCTCTSKKSAHVFIENVFLVTVMLLMLKLFFRNCFDVCYYDCVWMLGASLQYAVEIVGKHLNKCTNGVLYASSVLVLNILFILIMAIKKMVPEGSIDFKESKMDWLHRLLGILDDISLYPTCNSSNDKINVKTSIVKVEEIPYTKPQNEQQKTTPLERELCVASRLSTTLDNISATAIVFPVAKPVKFGKLTENVGIGSLLIRHNTQSLFEFKPC